MLVSASPDWKENSQRYTDLDDYDLEDPLLVTHRAWNGIIPCLLPCISTSCDDSHTANFQDYGESISRGTKGMI